MRGGSLPAHAGVVDPSYLEMFADARTFWRNYAFFIARSKARDPGPGGLGLRSASSRAAAQLPPTLDSYYRGCVGCRGCP